MSANVLIVEDEVTLLDAMTRALQALPGVAVTACPTAEDALEVLTRRRPDVIVLDINLPGISGLDLLEDIAELDTPVPVIITTAYRQTYLERLQPHSGLTVLEKPVPMRQLADLITQELQRSTGPAGQELLYVADYVQLAAYGRHSVMINVRLDDGSLGEIVVLDGEIWSARCGELSGLDALTALVRSKALKISFDRLESPTAERQITGSAESLLLEIARQEDEEKRDNPRREPAAPDEKPDFEEVFGRAMAAYLERSYDVALKLFEECRRMEPNNEQVQHNLERIRQKRGMP